MIEIKNLCFEIGEFSLKDVCLSVDSDEYFVLLGPTGAGKSLLIKCICGLLRVSRGSVHIDGQDVTNLEPRLREIGYVPQDCGLFPHLSVENNVIFSLRARGLSRRKALQRIEPLIEMLRLGPLLKRSPSGLSGGERQKVALGRALALQPKLLLLDEPVSALDISSRQEVCVEIRRVQKELRISTIHVSHNMEEAFSVADRAAVLNEGEVVQTGPVSDLLRKPKNETVARFLRTENIFHGTAAADTDGGSVVSFAGHRIRIAERCEGEITFTVRPEMLSVVAPASSADNSISAVLLDVADRGAYERLELDAGGGLKVVVYTPVGGATSELVTGRKYSIVFPADSVHVLEE